MSNVAGSSKKMMLEVVRRPDLIGEPWAITEVRDDGTKQALLIVHQEPVFVQSSHEPRPDVIEALRPFVELYEKVDERYRKRGGNPDVFKDTHPFSDIPAGDLPMGVWRRAQAAFRASQPPAPDCVSIPLSIAKTIDSAFLPNNPNRLRNAHRDTVIAAHRFKDAVRTALMKPAVLKCASCDGEDEVAVRPICSKSPICKHCFAVWYDGCTDAEKIRRESLEIQGRATEGEEVR